MLELLFALFSLVTRNENVLTHVTNSQNPGDLSCIYKPFSWQSTRKVVFVPTLPLQKWTSGIFSCSLA